MIGRAKYDAWAKVKGLSKDGAMKKYVALVKSLGG
jgi:acyl-CoA-binding protein